MTRCIGKTCLDGPREGDEPMPRWADDGLLCPRCSAGLEQRLAELPARRDQLRAILGGLRSSQRGENRPTKGTPPVPLNLAAHDHLDLIQSTVVSWTQLVAEERGLRGPDRSDVTVLSSWLLSQHPWLVGQPWVDDLAEEMRDLSRVADSLTQQTRRPTRAGADCFACEGPLMRPVASNGLEEDRVVCAGCGLEYDPAQYHLALAAAAEAAAQVEIDGDLWATPEWLAAQLGRSVNTLKAWRRDGLVAVRHVSGLAFLKVEDAERQHAERPTRQREAS